MTPEEIQADDLQRLWEQDRDGNETTQIIDLELEDLEEWNEIDDRDGRDDASEYEASME